MGGSATIRAFAPGRVNLIGEHTDYSGGWALPMAIDLGTTVAGHRGGGRLRLRSAALPEELDAPLPITEPAGVLPGWGRYPAAVAAELRYTDGLDATVTTTLPVGAGLSSSASFEVATALAMDADHDRHDLALLAQRAEHRATGVPCGIIDQLASACGVSGSALLIDCESTQSTPVAIPERARFVVVDSGQARTLEGSPYAERRAAVERATARLGALRDCPTDDLERLDDPVVRRRARHVISENRRVLDFVAALQANDLGAAGALMTASHMSLRDDFEVSTPVLDHLVDDLISTTGVHGARLTGAGFGGCVIALCEPTVTIAGGLVVTASGGARLL